MEKVTQLELPFGEWLKEKREKACLSRKELGKQAGIKACTIGKIESGHIKRPPDERLEGFSKALKIPFKTIKEKVLAVSVTVLLFAASAWLTGFHVPNFNLPYFIASMSGGKDSTEMLCQLMEKGYPVDEIVYCDTGWEFEEMENHIDRVESYINSKITRVYPEKPFDYWLQDHVVVGRQGKNKGVAYRTGCGWPSSSRRWCTREKIRAINKYLKGVENQVRYIGFALDEAHRVKSDPTIKGGKEYSCAYPLISDFKLTEKQCLRNCQKRGFDWGGLYDFFDRVSCFCCPLQNNSALKALWQYFPKYWNRMLDMEKGIKSSIGFKGYKSVHDFTKQFEAEHSGKLELVV